MADMISAMNAIFAYFIDQFALCLDTILNNPVLLLPVLLGLVTGVIFFVVQIIKKMGVRGRHG